MENVSARARTGGFSYSPVTRDRQMLELHGRDPRYGFDRHKGYATAVHLSAVAEFGYSDAHRRSFRPHTLFDTID